jgi:hypothetical protein
MSDTNMGGGKSINAIYKIDQVGYPENLGNVAYIGPDSELYNYPESNIGLSNNYTQFNNFDSGGNDIRGIRSTTVDNCKDICNGISNCHGFVFDRRNNNCWIKNENMYPNSQKRRLQNADLYVRTPRILNPPIGIRPHVNTIDSIQYQNYKNTGQNVPISNGLANISSVHQKQLEQLETKLNLLSTQIVNLTGQFSKGNKLVNNRISSNSETILERFENMKSGNSNYLNELKDIREKIAHYKSENNVNIDNILDDSAIVVLKENYKYILWSSLTVLTIIVSMNIVKPK